MLQGKKIFYCGLLKAVVGEDEDNDCEQVHRETMLKWIRSEDGCWNSRVWSQMLL